MSPTERTLFVQVLGQVLIADGVLSDAERAYLDRVMDGLGMPLDERKAALAGISLDSPIEERVAGLGPEARTRLGEEIERALGADGEVRRSDTALIARVRAYLGATT